MPWQSVCEKCQGDSRIYWYNTSDSDVSWENPFVKMNAETQEVTEDVLKIVKSVSIGRIINIEIHRRLVSAFVLWNAWTKRDESGRVRLLSRVLDSWMKMKLTLLFALKRRDEILEHNAVVNIRNEHLLKTLEDMHATHQELVTRLADSQVRCAQAEHDLLLLRKRNSVQRV